MKNHFLNFVAVDLAKDDDADEILKKLEQAIEGSPTSKRRRSEDNAPVPSNQINSKNGDTKGAEENRNGSVSPNSIFKSTDREKFSKLCSDTSEIDDDKTELEDDLLKDFEDDPNEDLDSVCEEVKNMMESVLEGEEASKDSTNAVDSEEISQDMAVQENIEEKDPIVDPEKGEGDEKESNLAEKEVTFKATDKESTSEMPKPEAAVESTNKFNPESEVMDPDPTENNSKATQQEVESNKAADTKIDELIDEEAAATTKESSDGESKCDDLLVACASPKELPTTLQGNSSETSSSAGDNPEDSNDYDKQVSENGNSNDGKTEQMGDESNDAEDQDADKGPVEMEVDDTLTIGELLPPAPSNEAPEVSDIEEELHLCMVQEDELVAVEQEVIIDSNGSPHPKELAPLKLPFLRKFASAVGKLSRTELEQLLLEKITESIMFCSENTDIRNRLEKQEKISESYQKRLDNINKQYKDLEMIHNRVIKDLKDRPDVPIAPVKITRAVGLQVYQPQPRNKFNPVSSQISSTTITKSLKRPLENETVVNGSASPSVAASLSPETKKKKTIKTTPMRPPLSDVQRKSLELEEAKVEQNLRKNVIGGIASVVIPPSVTMTPVPVVITNGGTNFKKALSSQSIDLTDDNDEPNTISQLQTPQPPALVAIRNQQRAFLVQPSLISQNRIIQQRGNLNRKPL